LGRNLSASPFHRVGLVEVAVPLAGSPAARTKIRRPALTASRRRRDAERSSATTTGSHLGARSGWATRRAASSSVTTLVCATLRRAGEPPERPLRRPTSRMSRDDVLVSDSRRKPDSPTRARTASRGSSRGCPARPAPLRRLPAAPGRRHSRAGRRSAQPTHHRTRVSRQGKPGAMREDHRRAARALAGHRNSDASTSSRWDLRRRNRAGGWSARRRISSTLGYTK
jgi:hypothetical protein